MGVDLKGAAKLGAVIALLVGAWFVVKMLKPAEGDLELINTRDGDFGDMTSAAQRRASGAVSDADVSGLDMVPTSSLPLSGPEKPAPPPEPAPRAVTTTAPPEPAPAPVRVAPRPVRREKPRLQATDSVTGGQTATSSAFMAAPEDEQQQGKKK